MISNNNWNSVCNGGIGMGALAIADEDGQFETISGQMLQIAVKYLPKMMNNYAPYSNWYEGPTRIMPLHIVLISYLH
jgi:hypothetical protein